MNLVRVSQIDVKEYTYNWPTSPDTVRIEVMAHQWAWNTRYAGPDGKFNTPDDIVTLNEIRVPVGRPVMLHLEATDVIHSFYLPELPHQAGRDARHDQPHVVPGAKPGKFEIALRAALRVEPLQDEGRPHRPSPEATTSAGEGGRAATRSAASTRPTRNSAWGWDWEQDGRAR